VLVLDANASNLRFFYGRNVEKAYTSQISLLVRLVVSLRAANTTLPIQLLVSGHRVPAVEQRLATLLGVTILAPESAPAVFVPRWGSKWARSSFAKLRVLALSHLAVAIVLDTDSIVLRSIDHLATRAPPPAFVFGWKCYPRRELRAATMVLAPSPAAWARAQGLLADPATAVYDDLGEGSVWRRLYERAHALPAGYGALRCTDLPAAEWDLVHVLHDPNLLRKAARDGWKEARMVQRLQSFDASTGAVLSELNPLISEAHATAHAARKASSSRRKGRRK
jgi:hypothetical protein